MRTIIYIDGFNFYYRAVKNTKYKWLDFKSLFLKLLSSKNQIIQIKYFTALVSGKHNPNKPVKQQTYIRALQSFIPEIKVYYGHFLSHKVYLPTAEQSNKNKKAKVIKTEEKGSDVNLAVHLLNDAWLNKYDCAIIVSNDSD
ncbi:MAG: NYN domain-containing protein [Ignavibacterium sp.]|nr:NYN domain-containing protein [Ignavibacterium sp.]